MFGILCLELLRLLRIQFQIEIKNTIKINKRLTIFIYNFKKKLILKLTFFRILI
jgi:hypothetical protein